MSESDGGSIIEREARRVRRVVWPVWLSQLVLLSVMWLCFVGRPHDWRSWAILAGIAAAMLAVQWAGARALERSARALDAAEDSRAIGPLLDTYSCSRWFRCHAAEPALARHLRLAQCSGDKRLSSEQVAELRQALMWEGSWPLRGRRMSAELTLAALDAIAASDPQRALSTLRQFTHPKVRPGVRHAVERVLVRLEQRARDAERTNRLLRPATAPEGTDTLLRPAHGAQSVEDDTLLRPVDGEEARVDAAASHRQTGG